MEIQLPDHLRYLRYNQQLLTLYQYCARRKMVHSAAGVVADTCAKVVALEQKESAESESVESVKQNSEEWLELVETMTQMMRFSHVPFNGTFLLSEYSGCSRGAFTEWVVYWINRQWED